MIYLTEHLFQMNLFPVVSVSYNYKVPTKRLVQSVHIIIISLNVICFLSWYYWKIAHLALSTNHSLTLDIKYLI
jgi:hypothetical protein